MSEKGMQSLLRFITPTPTTTVTTFSHRNVILLCSALLRSIYIYTHVYHDTFLLIAIFRLQQLADKLLGIQILGSQLIDMCPHSHTSFLCFWLETFNPPGLFFFFDFFFDRVYVPSFLSGDCLLV